MMRRLAALVLATGLVLVPAATATAQEADPEPLPLQLELLDARDHPHVEMTISMPPELVGAELAAEAFALTENGETVAALVEPVPTEGLDVVLAMDTSGSMRGAALAGAKAAAVAFVSQMPGDVRVALVAFGVEADVVSPFTSDRNETASAIEALSAGGETALYDGLVAATKLFDGELGARRVVVMLSDGGDTVSTGSLEESIVSLLTADARFYAVELQTAENDHEPLARLGAATDGQVVPADDPEALDVIFGEIAAAIVSQYKITFDAQAFGQTQLNVTVTSLLGATAVLSQVVRFPPPPPLPPAPRTPAPVPEPAPASPAPVVVPSPVQLPVHTVVLGWLASRQALLVGIAALGIAFFGLALYLARSGHRVTLAAADARARIRTRNKSLLSKATEGVTGLAERTLERRGRKGQLDRALEAAGMTLRSGEFTLMVLAGGLTTFIFGYLFATPLIGLALGGLFALVAWMWVARKASQRRSAFAEQLGSTLQLISGSLRAGFGLMQAIDVVAEESSSPTAEEFRRVKVEAHLGRDLDATLAAMAVRVGSEDFELFIEAVQIHREIGGELSQIVENVAETIRERHRLKGQIRALSAEGRFSATVLTALPLGMGAFLFITNPDYVAELTSITGGRIVLAGGALLMLIGFVWLKRLVRLDY